MAIKPVELVLDGRNVIDICIERGQTRSCVDAFISEAWFEDVDKKLTDKELEKLQTENEDVVQKYAVNMLDCFWE